MHKFFSGRFEAESDTYRRCAWFRVQPDMDCEWVKLDAAKIAEDHTRLAQMWTREVQDAARTPWGAERARLRL